MVAQKQKQETVSYINYFSLEVFLFFFYKILDFSRNGAKSGGRFDPFPHQTI